MKLASIVLSLSLGTTHLQGEIAKKARPEDTVSHYTLDNNGRLFMSINQDQCLVATHVKSFKIALHPQDTAMVYFLEESGDLYVLNKAAKSPFPFFRGCPPPAVSKLLSGVIKYSLIQERSTSIVNLALSADGRFIACDLRKCSFQEKGVKAYKVNRTYQQKNSPNSAYVAFLYSADHYILKLKGKTPQTSLWDVRRAYPSLEAFLGE